MSKSNWSVASARPNLKKLPAWFLKMYFSISELNFDNFDSSHSSLPNKSHKSILKSDKRLKHGFNFIVAKFTQKFNNENSRTSCEICTKLKIQTPEQCQCFY